MMITNIIINRPNWSRYHRHLLSIYNDVSNYFSIKELRLNCSSYSFNQLDVWYNGTAKYMALSEHYVARYQWYRGM